MKLFKPLSVAATFALCGQLLAEVTLVSESGLYVLKEKSRGVYCDGEYKRYKPEFVFILKIGTDTKTNRKTMSWQKVGKYGGKSFNTINQGFVALVSDRPSFISSKPERAQKRESVFVGQTGAGVVETFLIGPNYFEYSKVGMGQIALASGSLIAIDSSEDLTKYLK